MEQLICKICLEEIPLKKYLTKLRKCKNCRQRQTEHNKTIHVQKDTWLRLKALREQTDFPSYNKMIEAWLNEYEKYTKQDIIDKNWIS